MCICVYVYVHLACMYLSMCVCVYVYMHTYIHTYITTYYVDLDAKFCKSTDMKTHTLCLHEKKASTYALSFVCVCVCVCV